MIHICSLSEPAGIRKAVGESQLISSVDVKLRHPLDDSVLPGHQAEIGIVGMIQPVPAWDLLHSCEGGVVQHTIEVGESTVRVLLQASITEPLLGLPCGQRNVAKGTYYCLAFD